MKADRLHENAVDARINGVDDVANIDFDRRRTGERAQREGDREGNETQGAGFHEAEVLKFRNDRESSSGVSGPRCGVREISFGIGGQSRGALANWAVI
jgi:hypothetical protein